MGEKRLGRGWKDVGIEKTGPVIGAAVCRFVGAG
jgi:hypothetical protein